MRELARKRNGLRFFYAPRINSQTKGFDRWGGMNVRRRRTPLKPYHVVSYGVCPECTVGSIAIQANGRVVRHSDGGFGYVEKVGPGTRHPRWRTTICKGSGVKVAETDPRLKQ